MANFPDHHLLIKMAHVADEVNDIARTLDDIRADQEYNWDDLSHPDLDSPLCEEEFASNIHYLGIEVRDFHRNLVRFDAELNKLIALRTELGNLTDLPFNA